MSTGPFGGIRAALGRPQAWPVFRLAWGRPLFTGASFLIAALFAAGIAVSGYGLVAETIMFGEVMPTELRWPVWIFNLSVPIGGTLLTVQLLRHGVGCLRNFRHD